MANPDRDAQGNVVASQGAVSAGAAQGFLIVPTCAGSPTGTPASYPGSAAVVWDSVGLNLYAYTGGSWNVVGGGAGFVANPLTSDLNAGSHKITTLAAGVASNDAVNFTQLSGYMPLTGDPVAMTGGLVPNALNTLNLGKNTKPWKAVFLGDSGAALTIGTGVPTNGSLPDGSYYFRSDGGAVTHIYFASGGTWAAIV